MKSLVFLHGGPGFPDYLGEFFRGQFNTSADGSIQEVFYDQRSGATTTIADLVLQLHEIIKSEPHDTILIGHSWGGILALEYLRTHEHAQVKGLVLIDSFLSARHGKAEYEVEMKRLGMTEPTWEQIFLSYPEQAEGLEFLNRLKKNYDPAAIQSLSTFINTFDLNQTFQNLNLPILNIFGEFDLRVPARIMRTFPDLNANVKNVEIRGAGHFPFILPKNRALIVKAIQNFLSKQL